MQCHEVNEFWKEIKKHGKSKSALSNCIDGVTGESSIADVWRDHYDTLLSSCTNFEEKQFVLERFNSLCNNVGMYVTMAEVMQIVHGLPKGKSPGMDGLTRESIKKCRSINITVIIYMFYLYVQTFLYTCCYVKLC